MDLFLQFAAPALAGIFVGVMSGLLGVGGGTIMVPIFRLAFGMSPLASTATSLFAIIPTSISGVASHMRAKTCVPKLGVALGLGGAIMSPVGVWLASVSPGWMVIVVAALVIGFSAYKMFKKAIAAPKKKKAASSCRTARPVDVAAACGGASRVEAEGLRTEVRGASASPMGRTAAGAPAGSSKTAAQPAPKAVPAQPDLTRKQYLQGAAIGLIAGLASGYVGVGGGFIMVPMMLAILGIPMSLASGTSLIAIMILAIPGVIEQGLLGNINYIAGISIVIGTIPGAVIGARLVRVIPERQLRFAFGGFLLVAAVLLMLNEFGILG